METITLKLSVDEANAILQSLGNMPYVQVHQLIKKIQQQAGLQLQEMKEQQNKNSEEKKEIKNKVPSKV